MRRPLLLLALLLTLGGCARPTAPADPSGPANPTSPVSPVSPVQLPDPGWPPTVSPPSPTAPALPADHGVGQAQLLVTCAGCHWNLHLADGHEYVLPAAADRVTSREDGATAGGYLSPDGRWLAITQPITQSGVEESTYRDLTGTTVRRFGTPLAWSTNGRWVVSLDGGFHRQRLDLQTGTVTTFGAATGELAGVTDSGALVTVRPAPNPFVLPSINPRPSISPGTRAGGFTVTILGPAPDARRDVSGAATDLLDPAEQKSEGFNWTDWTVTGDGTTLAAFGRNYQAGSDPFLATFRLADGAARGRSPLTASETWTYTTMRYSAGGPLLVQTVLSGNGRTELRRLAPETGAWSVLSTAPNTVEVRLRGFLPAR